VSWSTTANLAGIPIKPHIIAFRCGESPTGC
jgi:hypothetical protein